jgi:hypothetical protein
VSKRDEILFILGALMAAAIVIWLVEIAVVSE